MIIALAEKSPIDRNIFWQTDGISLPSPDYNKITKVEPVPIANSMKNPSQQIQIPSVTLAPLL